MDNPRNHQSLEVPTPKYSCSKNVGVVLGHDVCKAVKNGGLVFGNCGFGLRNRSVASFG